MAPDHQDRQQAREARRAERARRRAARRARRERGEAEEPKERVLHTRISHQLAEEIRQVADELRVPVSNLVRNVLEEAFSVVETVSENVGELLEDILDEAEAARDRYRSRSERWEEPAAAPAPGEPPAAPAAPAPPAGPARPEFADVLGWQALVLNRNALCADCGVSVERGERGFVGLGGAGSPVLCRDCGEARS
jgi:hypothetical protein